MAGTANSGRRKHTFITDALLMEIKERERQAADGNKTGIRLMASKIMDLAEAGERWAAEYVRDTVDGRPMQQVEHSGSIATPSTLTDSDLASIIEGGSSDGAAETPPGPSRLN